MLEYEDASKPHAFAVFLEIDTSNGCIDMI